ncbi:hypothetical protein ACP70R_046661 [Stipagrostis hirtigluma subsp. patula]
MARRREEEEEEEEEASTGSGGWRSRPSYAVGAEVEVRLDGAGFRGAHFEATVAARLPGSGGYEVVFSTLLARRGGPPLREVVAPTHVRPRPPPPRRRRRRGSVAGRGFELFDLVEAYESDGWWPGVVSGILPGKATRYAVTFPVFRQEVKLRASQVRPRREFVCGSWMDAQEVLRGIPLYAEGSSVDVMCDKKGRAWMPATIVKMVGTANYVVRYGNGKGSIEVLHSRFIRPQPIFDKLKFEYELEPSVEVEVYQDGIWSLGVIADVGSCQTRRYGVRVKRHDSANEYYYLIVTSASLRPYSKWDSQEWTPCSDKKHAKKGVCAVSVEERDSPVFSTTREDNDQYSSVPKKRLMTENLEKKEPCLRHPLHLRQDTDRSLLKDVMDIETPSDKHATAKKKLGQHCFLKELPRKRKDLPSTSSHDIVEIDNKSSYADVVVISDDSGYGSVIEISDSSSSIPNRKKRRMNLSDEETHSSHLLHRCQASWSASNLLRTQDTHHDLFLEVTRHSGEQLCSHVLSHSVLPQESSLDPSHKDSQLIPLPVCRVQGLLGINETKEPILSHHLHLESSLMALDDPATGDKNHEMCEEFTESCVRGTCNEREDTDPINSKNSNQNTIDRLYGEASPAGKLEPCSSAQQDVKADLLCIQAPKDNKMEIKDVRTGMSPKEATAFPIGKLEPYSSAQDLLCMQASNNNKIEIKNARIGMASQEASDFHLETCMNSKEIADVPLPECNASSQHPLGQCKVSISSKSAGPSSFLLPGVMVDLSAFIPLSAANSSTLPPVFSTSSLLLMPDHKMEVFKMLPQIPHFREVWDCPPEFREGKALGLVVSFANMAESIKNMQIQDESQLYQEKMSHLLDLEENGFEVGALKVRLHDLLRIRNRQIDLKKRKTSLDKEILQIELANCGVEQRLKLLDITGLGEELMHYRETKASLTRQNSVNCSYILKLQNDLRQVEESLMSAEADFVSVASAPWRSDVGPSLL